MSRAIRGTAEYLAKTGRRGTIGLGACDLRRVPLLQRARTSARSCRRSGIPTLVLCRPANVTEDRESGPFLAAISPEAVRGAARERTTCRGPASIRSVLDEVEDSCGVRRTPRTVDRVLATCCSPTSSAQRRRRRRWATVPGESSASPTTIASAIYSSSIGDARWTRRATGSSPRSTDPRGPYGARRPSPRPSGPLGVEIRAGCHTGEVEVVGEDVAGVAVHIGARVCALAGPVGGAGLVDREGPHRRKRARLRGRGRARAEGRPRPLAPVPGGGVNVDTPRHPVREDGRRRVHRLPGRQATARSTWSGNSTTRKRRRGLGAPALGPLPRWLLGILSADPLGPARDRSSSRNVPPSDMETRVERPSRGPRRAGIRTRRCRRSPSRGSGERFVRRHRAGAGSLVRVGFPEPRSLWAPDYPWGVSDEDIERSRRVTEEHWGTDALFAVSWAQSGEVVPTRTRRAGQAVPIHRHAGRRPRDGSHLERDRHPRRASVRARARTPRATRLGRSEPDRLRRVADAARPGRPGPRRGRIPAEYIDGSRSGPHIPRRGSPCAER